MISVQHADFDVGVEYAALTRDEVSAGAVVFFVGRVRDLNLAREVKGLILEHYPGMTEKALADIVEEARQRWQITRWRVIHRIGELTLGNQIVFVGITSPHRQDAFLAAEFVMDFLKTRAPFWKKELTVEGDIWVDAREADVQASERWQG